MRLEREVELCSGDFMSISAGEAAGGKEGVLGGKGENGILGQIKAARWLGGSKDLHLSDIHKVTIRREGMKLEGRHEQKEGGSAH